MRFHTLHQLEARGKRVLHVLRRDKRAPSVKWPRDGPIEQSNRQRQWIECSSGRCLSGQHNEEDAGRKPA